MIHEKEDNILILNHIRIGYQNKKNTHILVNDVHASIYKPKLIGIIGKNGSGKSTLLRSLAHLQPILSGQISYLNQPLPFYQNNRIAHMLSVVLTEPFEDSFFTVKDIVAMGRLTHTNRFNQLQTQDKELIEQALQELSLKDVEHQLFIHLSDGQKQKVKIATAFTQQTPLLLLDEPTSHLDVHHAMELYILFKKWVNQLQKTIIFTTHEISWALQFCDAIWVLHEKEFYCGTPDEILHQNILSKVFDSEYVMFDTLTKQFTYKTL